MRMPRFLFLAALLVAVAGCGLIEIAIFGRLVVRDGQNYVVMEDYDARALRQLEAAFGSISPMRQQVYAVAINGNYRALGTNFLLATPDHPGPLGLGVYDEADRPLVLDVIEHVNDDAPDNVIMRNGTPVDNIADAVTVLTGVAALSLVSTGPLLFLTGAVEPTPTPSAESDATGTTAFGGGIDDSQGD